MSRRNVITIATVRCSETLEPMERALLPWEDRTDFHELRTSLHREHKPEGATEASLVDHLAWNLWRRRRLVVGERAAHMAALQERLGTDYKALETVHRAMIETAEGAEKDELAAALSTTPAKDSETLADTDEDEGMTCRAVAILETGDPAGYGEALAALRPDTVSWWEDVVGDDEQTHPSGKPNDGDSYLPYSRTRDSLLRFLNDEVLTVYKKTRDEIARRPVILLQAQGESLDPFRMDRILALDERLLRQFEKTLAMLVRLKEMRLSTVQSA